MHVEAMTPRAQALARILISRVREFEAANREQPPRGDAEHDEQRRKLVEKVLFSEVGLTDFAKARLVAVAMPPVRNNRDPGDRELRELAEFLDAHLDWAALTP
jgi:hypothetical protein